MRGSLDSALSDSATHRRDSEEQRARFAHAHRYQCVTNTHTTSQTHRYVIVCSLYACYGFAVCPVGLYIHMAL